MLSWMKQERVQASYPWETPLYSYMARTALGSAIITEERGGSIVMDMWKPDQTNIGTGKFVSVDIAKSRAETILDPRTTCWDFINDWCVLDETG